MADEECWTIRAQAEALRTEVSTLRSVVAALRSTRASEPGRVAQPRPRWHLPAAAFALGVLLTLTALSMYRVLGCP